MTHKYEHKLDNPVWFSLSETHQSFAIEYPAIKFYDPDYCAFGGFEKAADTAVYIDAYATKVENFFVIGEKPSISKKVVVKKELVCLQMIIEKRMEIATTIEIVRLDDTCTTKLYDLINLVQPGYFKRKTALLGNYFGIFKDDELVAVTGERLQLNDYTEISAVVTHPLHTGQGYAKQLVAHAANNVFDQNKIPHLHVAEINSTAIKLYEKLGFRIRRKMRFWNIGTI